MLTAGIVLIAASVVVGALALTLAALMSSPARSAVGRARRGVGARRAKEDRRYHELFGPAEGQRAPQRRASSSAQEAQEPPRWVVGLAGLAGAGLVLGLVLVMIPSVT